MSQHTVLHPQRRLTSCSSPVDEYWQNHPELHDIPIYYASSLAKKCMAVYQTYVNAMNDKIRKAININNPFVFKHISNLKVQSAQTPLTLTLKLLLLGLSD